MIRSLQSCSIHSRVSPGVPLLSMTMSARAHFSASDICAEMRARAKEIYKKYF